MEVKNLQNQKGFTLVEIAIVLVIIGLLLGGVLKGQEMINAAKIKSDTDTLVAIQASTYAYRDRMGYYPGTARSAAPNTLTANKLTIENGAGTATPWVTSGTAGLSAIQGTDLPGDFFVDLGLQGFLKDPNITPEVDDAATISVGIANPGATGTVTVEANKNYVCMNYTAGVDNAEELLRGMDIKLDDGNPVEGKFRYDAGTGAGAAASGCLEF
ncbi:prepilin-type N-terminal cleavage/methylation domain-containing protein [Thiomicrorhabdus immobilis]|uniref:Prepilin-type N-terminal cleavage/methylation domain-containing protein n=1 Tax=Thiomicrorhabdus immobilis TaxID=2791037 RepID=A0ABM7MF27_9GAMM|nr:prepilin-type N-terminal cleavage/methylation domain-containing protein [Thiomicrorhabdus immobilis]BCN94029.1 prepilin-type N-terminal cleavage/methylation domain-containing protein [Thiomicrorhabdus immobilis]